MRYRFALDAVEIDTEVDLITHFLQCSEFASRPGTEVPMKKQFTHISTLLPVFMRLFGLIDAGHMR